MIWFIADTHFNHANIIKYCNRPFKDVDEMNSIMLKNWNDRISENDTVYIIGDFAMSGARGILPHLKGRKILIEGSHDEDTIKTCKLFFENITLRLEVRWENRHIILSHYCMRVWPKSHYNTWHLYGHSHGRLEPVGKSWDVGVDNTGFKPLSFDEVVAIMEKRPDNPDNLNHPIRP